MTKIIECFEVLMWDGGERHNHECYIQNEEDARNIAGQHGLVLNKTFIIFDNINQYKDNKNGKIKEIALSKLTKIERLALGFE